MRYGWIVAFCLGWLLAGCQSEQEEVTEPQAPITAPMDAGEPASSMAAGMAAEEAEEAAAAGMGDAARGMTKAARCKACHSFDEGGGHKMGPNLFGVFGRTAGSAAGFKYSDDLGNAGFVWDRERLTAWVCDSTEAIRQLTGKADAKTKMMKQRVCGDDAADVAAFLESLK